MVRFPLSLVVLMTTACASPDLSPVPGSLQPAGNEARTGRASHGLRCRIDWQIGSRAIQRRLRLLCGALKPKVTGEAA
jgi:hypothetical protein